LSPGGSLRRRRHRFGELAAQGRERHTPAPDSDSAEAEYLLALAEFDFEALFCKDPGDLVAAHSER
jgi:hypothetical protein